MSRRALWPATAPAAAANGRAGCELDAAPTGASVAPSPTLPARSDLTAQVKFARLADLLAEAAQVFRELSEVPLAPVRDSRLMSHVETSARLLTAEDLAARLQVDAKTIRRWRKAGKIPAGIEISGVVRWTPESIESLIGGRS